MLTHFSPGNLNIVITAIDINSGKTSEPSISLVINLGLPLSNICFPKDTLVNTDQGIIKIQEIKNNTINGLKVEHITEIISNDNYLVCFEKDALYPNCPSEKTIITRNHRLLYNGIMVNADSLLSEHQLFDTSSKIYLLFIFVSSLTLSFTYSKL